jgi:hypothetical protein
MVGAHRAQQFEPERLLLCEKAHELRRKGLSYPQIAKELGVSLGLSVEHDQPVGAIPLWKFWDGTLRWGERRDHAISGYYPLT